MSSWVPIVEESSELAASVWESIDAIATSLSDTSSRSSEIELRCNLALFYAYLARTRQDRKHIELAMDNLNLAIETANSQSSLSLYGGLSGLGWTIKHVLSVLKGSLISVSDETTAHEDTSFVVLEHNGSQLSEEIDGHLVSQLRLRKDWPYDLIYGLVGFGIYFLEGNCSLNCVDQIELLLAFLEASAEYTATGVRWRTDPKFMSSWEREQIQGGFYNLGVAHGVPGVLFLLAKLTTMETFQQRAGHLLMEGFDWLVSQENRGRRPARFDLWIPPPFPAPSRLAWCYNDLGIAAVMLQVSRITGDSRYHHFASDLLSHCITIANDLRSPDANLCHGAAGVAHIMNRTYQSLGNPHCLEISLSYLKRILTMRQPGIGIGGYTRPTSKAPGQVTWVGDPRFLNGAVGVGLALLSFVTSIEPQWDRLMLLS